MADETGTSKGSMMKTALVTAPVWLVPAVLSSTQQWAQLQETSKQMSWLAAFLYQAPSWALLWLASPIVIVAARRWPIEGKPIAKPVLLHTASAGLFGLAFLFASVPLREMLHPKPVAWEFFGVPYFKSGPQFVAVGAFAYGVLVLIGSLLDTRARLRLVTAEQQGSMAEPPEQAEEPRLIIETRVGQSVLEPGMVLWAQPDAAGGCVLKTESGEIRARTSLAVLEEQLAEHGFCRVHRSKLVNVARITEVVGGAHREAEARLDTGDVVPVSRRRRDELAAALGS